MVTHARRTADRRGFAPVAWMLALGALALSLSGWFAIFGLVLAVVALAVSAAVPVKGAFITAAAAACVSVVWALIDVLAS